MAKGLIDTIFDKIIENIQDDEWKGRYGEKLTARELKFANFLGKKGKILRNVYLPKDDGETSELDVIYITQKGIIVFESKNYSGWIFGDEKGKNWTMMLPNKQKSQFYNPILQNRTHLKWLRNYIGADIPLFSIVVFSERCELKKVNVESKDVAVIKRDRTYAAVRDIWDANPDALTSEQVEDLYTKLKVLTKVDKAVKIAHVENINSKFGKDISIEMATEAEQQNYVKEEDVDNKEKLVENTPDEEKPVETPKICPRCGNALVIRVAKKGENAGKEFYGCSNFPKCRYIENR